MFDNKKGFFIFILAGWQLVVWILAISTVAIGAFSYFTHTHDLSQNKFCVPGEEGCITPPPAPQPVQKECHVEDSNVCITGDAILNQGRDMLIACQSILTQEKGVAYFISDGSCLSCTDYYKLNGKLPNAVSMQWFLTQEACMASIYKPNPVCAEIKSKDDCAKITDANNVDRCFSIKDYEKYCKIDPKDPTLPCQDIKLLGVIPFPNVWCKLKEKMKDLFMPFQIIITILGGITAWLFTMWSLQNFNVFKGKHAMAAIVPISLFIGAMVGILIWFAWYIGIAILITLIILRVIANFVKIK